MAIRYIHAAKAGIEKRTSFMFPRLHKHVSNAVRDQIRQVIFQKKGRETQAYDTFVMGRYVCNNSLCDNKAWTSKKVGVVIRRFADSGHGIGYNATVFNQRCKSCDTLGNFSLDVNSYVERVAYRLRVWAGVPQEEAPFTSDEIGPPHEQDLCEGCKEGRCQRGKQMKSIYDDEDDLTFMK
ncbi:hypothetical protein PG997_012184 [Apiospora hydei]|uniref:3CxxC-type domain-containing protein n=1 Tax=Apiospora hydei TaxID=1337664 RepID=A0ABR1V3C1_9PEZI